VDVVENDETGPTIRCFVLPTNGVDVAISVLGASPMCGFPEEFMTEVFSLKQGDEPKRWGSKVSIWYTGGLDHSREASFSRKMEISQFRRAHGHIDSCKFNPGVRFDFKLNRSCIMGPKDFILGKI
jgi:hypothetical protein